MIWAGFALVYVCTLNPRPWTPNPEMKNPKPQTDRQTHRQASRQAARQTARQTDSQPARQPARQPASQPGRQAASQPANRQRDTQTGKQKKRGVEQQRMCCRQCQKGHLMTFAFNLHWGWCFELQRMCCRQCQKGHLMTFTFNLHRGIRNRHQFETQESKRECIRRGLS